MSEEKDHSEKIDAVDVCAGVVTAMVGTLLLAVVLRTCDDGDMTASGGEIRYRTSDYICAERDGETVCRGR